MEDLPRFLWIAERAMIQNLAEPQPLAIQRHAVIGCNADHSGHFARDRHLELQLQGPCSVTKLRACNEGMKQIGNYMFLEHEKECMLPCSV